MHTRLLPPAFLILFLCLLPFITIQCANESAMRAAQTAVQQVRTRYLENLHTLDSLVGEMQTALHNGNSERTKEQLRALFREARLAYKKTEYLVEYFHPYTVRSINGPALEDIEEEDPDRLIYPTGFQVIEEMLFAGEDAIDEQRMALMLRNLDATVQRTINTAQSGTITDEQVFDALRLEIARIITLGISGFDSPVAFHSLPEATASLQSIQDVLEIYLQPAHTDNLRVIAALTQGAQAFLAYNTTFEQFDRLTFITRFANPLARELHNARTTLGIAVPDVSRPFRTTAITLFDSAAFDPAFYAPGYTKAVNEETIQLGKLLFFDPVLSGNNRRACASCHQPEKAFTDGNTRSVAFDFNGKVERNAPTLLNAALQSGQFHDLRTTFLEDQANAVVHNNAEMHGSLQQAASILEKSPEYSALFSRAFPGTTSTESTVTEQHIRVALASYIRSLTTLNSRFDRLMRGDTMAFSVQERHGFNLFMGKARCGTCHFMPLFNGSAPPLFTKMETEILGVPATADTLHATLDPDKGRAAIFNINLDRFSFKTSTVRNIALTAPYMHNGVYTTLEQVIDFYNRGGGIGLGIPMERQTLPAYPLHLTREEQQNLIAFLHTLTDTTGTTSRPTRLPALPSPQTAHRRVGGDY